jgi:hypothetical protein
MYSISAENICGIDMRCVDEIREYLGTGQGPKLKLKLNEIATSESEKELLKTKRDLLEAQICNTNSQVLGGGNAKKQKMNSAAGKRVTERLRDC